MRSDTIYGIDEGSILYFRYASSKSRSIFKVFKDNQSCISVVESKQFSPRKKILLLCIIIYKASYKNIYFGYIILINPNKQKIFSLSHSLERYSCTYKENYLHDDLKGETFVSTKGSIRIQRTNQNHNSNNWFNLNGSSYFEMPQKQFRYQKKYHSHSNSLHHLNVRF